MILTMPFDQDRIQAILKVEHSYYGWRDIPIRKDTRWYPSVVNLITQQHSSGTRILDDGCRNGGLLQEFSTSFHTGIGIDNDPKHIQMDEEAKRAGGNNNVDFPQVRGK